MLKLEDLNQRPNSPIIPEVPSCKVEMKNFSQPQFTENREDDETQKIEKYKGKIADEISFEGEDQLATATEKKLKKIAREQLAILTQEINCIHRTNLEIIYKQSQSMKHLWMNKINYKIIDRQNLITSPQKMNSKRKNLILQFKIKKKEFMSIVSAKNIAKTVSVGVVVETENVKMVVIAFQNQIPAKTQKTYERHGNSLQSIKCLIEGIIQDYNNYFNIVTLLIDEIV